MVKKKILVTGAAGYIASKFLEFLVLKDWAGEIIGLDKQKPKDPVDNVNYITCDITSSKWEKIILETKPDILVHLAFIVNPIRDENLMRQINIDGTKKTFKSGKKVGVKHILVASSATAYGAWPDNPIPLTEEHPIRVHKSFQYGKEKGELESFYKDFANENSDIKISVIRPAIVYGPGVDNYLSRFIFAFPVVPLVGGGRTPMQLVHEDDVANIMIRILEKNKAGAFNIAAEDYMTLAEMCKLAGRIGVSVPRFILEPLLQIAWKFELQNLEAPDTILDYFNYSWVVSVDKVKKELDYSFQYSTKDTFMSMLKSRTDGSS